MIFLSRWRGIIRDVPSSGPWPAKQQRPAGGGRRSLLRRSSQSSIYMKRGDREREWERVHEDQKSPCQVVLIAFLYPCMLNVRFTLVKYTVQWGRLISSLTWFDWSHKHWRLPATKAHVRGLTHSGGRNFTLGQTWPHSKVGTNISLTLIMHNLTQ
jgi:hypothetical protein